MIWDPYRDIRDNYPFNEVFFFSGCLRINNIIEPYHLVWCLRQFGPVQSILAPPLGPLQVDIGATYAAYRVIYDVFDQYWDDWDSNLISTQGRRPKVVNPWDFVPQYFTWFLNIIDMYVQSPKNESRYDQQH